MSTAEKATIVIDNGTGYTKMGYAGNMEPSYLIPSVVATATKPKAAGLLARDTGRNFSNLEVDTFIGDEAQSKHATHDVRHLLRSAII